MSSRLPLKVRLPSGGARVLLAVPVLLAGVVLFGGQLDAHYPVANWLVWDLLKLWGWVALFSLACMSAGARLSRDVLHLRGLLPLEAGVVSMALGVVVFVLCTYLAGALGWFNGAYAVVLPVLMLSSGLGPTSKLLHSLFKDWLAPVGRGGLGRLITLYGVVCCLLLYLGAMTPDALNYDAAWYHVALAQDYAREGRIVPFYADYNRAVPQLASLLYTWCYLVPRLQLPLRWMLILHLEFSLFVWTLAGIAAAVRWVVFDPRLRGAWVAIFLFPILFVYDSNLGGAADHVLAFFAAALLVTLRHVWVAMAPPAAIAFALLTGGALLTKYQAIYVVLPCALALGWRWLVLLRNAWRYRSSRGNPYARVGRWRLAAPLVMTLCALLVFAPHLIKNAIFYHNPLYPFLMDVFPRSFPATPDASFYFEHVFQDERWIPRGSVWDKLLHSLELFFSFSFEPHYAFAYNLPVFGSLFTCLLFMLPLLRSRRLLLVALLASGALLIWGYTFNVDRNLQTFLPFIVVTTAGLIVETWRLGTLARAALVPLVGLQLAWGALVMVAGGYDRVNSALMLLKSGFDGRAGARYSGYRAVYRAIGRALPANARVLLHSHHLNLGINRQTYVDWTGYQGLIKYDHVKTAAELFAYYRSLGVTHVMWIPGERPASSLQEELVFGKLVSSLRGRLSFPPYAILPIGSTSPPQHERYRALTLGMPGYADGLYSVERLNVIEYLPEALRRYPAPDVPAPTVEAELDLLPRAEALFLGAGTEMPRKLQVKLRHFSRFVRYPGQFSLFLRTEGR